MKRTSILLATTAVVLYLAPLATAQHGHATGSGSMGHTASHSNSNSSSTSIFPSSAKVTSKLSSNLASKGLIPSGTSLSTYCQGFRNRGQCIAAIHVAHNLKLNFACLAHDATGQSNSAWGTVAGNCPSVSGRSSLGKAVQAIDPRTDSGTQIKKAKKQADHDLNDAQKSS